MTSKPSDGMQRRPRTLAAVLAVLAALLVLPLALASRAEAFVYWATAEELLTAKASGKIKVNPSYRLKPKTVKLNAGETKTLRVKPKKAAAKKIVGAMKDGEKATAKLKVRLTDVAGNTKTEKLRVRVRR